jgi:hypothetical protein
MSSIHQDILSNYEPLKLEQPNIKLLSNVLTEYRDYKFSNGFWVVGFELKGEYNNSNIIKNLDKLNASQVKELLNNLNYCDKELFNLAKKVFTNTASKEEFYDYTERLEKTDVMRYNWKCFSDSQK